MTEPSDAKVTLIIPSYNTSDMIEKTITSALEQTIETRVIVIDDCSTDDSFARIEAMAAREPRLIARRLSKNGGPSIARNVAIRMAETPWVAGLDSDDYLLPDRMRKMVEFAEANDLDFLADDVIRIEAGMPVEKGTRVWRDQSVGRIPVDLAFFVQENIRDHVGMRREAGYLKPMMRTAFLREHDLFFREDLRADEDYDFYARSLHAGARFEIIDPCGYIAVNREGSLSKALAPLVLEKVIEADKALRNSPKTSKDARRALSKHIQQYEADLSWLKMIEAVRAKDSAKALGVFAATSPAAMPIVTSRIVKHFLKVPVFQERK